MGPLAARVISISLLAAMAGAEASATAACDVRSTGSSPTLVEGEPALGDETSMLQVSLRTAAPNQSRPDLAAPPSMLAQNATRRGNASDPLARAPLLMASLPGGASFSLARAPLLMANLPGKASDPLARAPLLMASLPGVASFSLARAPLLMANLPGKALNEPALADLASTVTFQGLWSMLMDDLRQQRMARTRAPPADVPAPWTHPKEVVLVDLSEGISLSTVWSIVLSVIVFLLILGLGYVCFEHYYHKQSLHDIGARFDRGEQHARDRASHLVRKARGNDECC